MSKKKSNKIYINTQDVYQLHEQHKIANILSITSGHENEIMQLDQADLSEISTTNSNYKWLLCAVDVFTRNAYIVPMKNKTASNVAEAMKIILNKSEPENINCDKGSEFMSKEFKKTDE